MRRDQDIVLAGAVIAGFVLLSAVWLHADHRLLDGDALGVVGAVELFAGERQGHGVGAAIAMIWTSPSEYPPLHTIATGLLASGIRDWDGDGVALCGLLWAALAIGFTATAASAAAAGAEAATPADPTTRAASAAMAALLLAASPLWGGVARQPMIETMASTWVALCAALLLRGGTRSALLAGLVAGLAMLTKQTALIPLASLSIGACLTGRASATIRAAPIAVLVAAPWYAPRLARQIGYVLSSSGENEGTRAIALLTYPLTMVELAWAPPAAFVLLVAVIRGRGRGNRTIDVAAVACIALLTLLPKRYPRLLAPCLPLFAVALSVYLSGWSRRARLAVSSLLVGTAGLSAFARSPLGAQSLGLRDVDERCFQDVARPPAREPLPWDGLFAAIGGACDGACTIGSPAWPASPCEYQTTHDVSEHLRQRARRRGFPLDVRPAGEPADLMLSEGPCDGCGDVVARFPLRDPDWTAEWTLWKPR